MSQAFVKEQDDQWLHDIPCTVAALINFLTRENNGIRIYEVKTQVRNGTEIHVMSNGLEYQKDSEGRWQVVV